MGRACLRGNSPASGANAGALLATKVAPGGGRAIPLKLVK